MVNRAENGGTASTERIRIKHGPNYLTGSQNTLL